MSNNIFSGKRFQLLFKQHLIHNTQFLLLSSVAYIGVIFIVLGLVQLGNGLQPNNLEIFQGMLIGFVTVFGILYVGHSFPAFRLKESTINYLMLPASALEKFLFEFVNRVGILLIILPLLYWCTFNLQGIFFTIFTDEVFNPIGIKHLITIDVPDEYRTLIYLTVIGGVLIVFSLAFTGAAMFTKQPLIKTLFAVAIIVMFFVGYSYIMIEELGIGEYNPPERMWLVPLQEELALKIVTIVLYVSTLVMLFIAYRKLKEREV
jgi:hypothetical protein